MIIFHQLRHPTSPDTVLWLVLLISFGLQVHAAGGVIKDPVGTAPDRYVYYPGTESLAKNEIRLIACGTGLPAARRDQAATRRAR